eukprot:2599495-Alexandrium_andersonii.AAC.1
MSASLVGSEMCIRDSDSAARERAARERAARAIIDVTVRRSTSAGPVLGCLLYTSDAADDM